MIRRTLLWSAAFALVFLAGGVAGSLATQSVLRAQFFRSLQPEAWTATAERKLASRLALTPDQQAHVHGVLKGMGNEFCQTFSRALSDAGLTIVHAGQRIDACLTPDQRAIHAAMKERLRERLRRDLHVELPPELPAPAALPKP